MKRLVAGSAAAFALLALAPVTARAQAIRSNPEFSQNVLPANDDGSTDLVDLGFTLNFFGRTRSQAYVNNNGNITFDQALVTYTPFGLVGTHREIIAPFFADVDTRAKASRLVTYGRTTINGHNAFGVNYVNVGYYDQHSDKLNSFQLVLIERPDTGAGNFDIEFNYERVSWETGDASGGTNGFGGVSASIGWSNGSGDPGTSWEMEGSLIPGSFLDTAPHSLFSTRYSSAQTGRYQFRARGGILIPALVIETGCPLPNAVIGDRYQATLRASGETAPYSWTILPDPGITLPVSTTTSGLVTGEPKVPGTYSFTIQVAAQADGATVTAARRCSLTVDAPRLNVRTACPLPPATAGAAYSETLSASGGSGSYLWTSEGSLPAGIRLASNGTLSGTPTQVGTYPFTLKVASSDSVIDPGSRQCTLVVRAEATTPTISACPANIATAGVPYSQTLGISGGSAPYRWAIEGQLPAGLGITPAGVIAGIPTVAASYQFTLAATDNRGQVTRGQCTLDVASPALQLAPACPLPSGTAGMAYSQKLSAEGGVAPYTWTVAGVLPAGLRLSSDGLISGTPTAAGNSLFRLVATDSRSWTSAVGCSMSVARPAYSITGCPLPAGMAGQAYDAKAASLGGVEPYLFSVDGALPPGLVLSSNGRITGTPSTAGLYAFKLSSMDANGATVAQSCSLSIEPPMPVVATACPLPTAEIGKPYSVKFAAEGGAGPYQWLTSGNLPPDFSLSSDGVFAGTPSRQGTYSFTILGSDARSRAIARECSITTALPAAPQISVIDMPATIAPATSNLSTGVELSAAYNLPIQGIATLSVSPQTGADSEENQADPMVRFSNGQQSIRFTVPAGSRRVLLPLVSSGTVASNVVFAIKNLEVAGNKLPILPSAKVFSVAAAPPVLTTACYATRTGGVDITVTGYATTRQISSIQATIDGKLYAQSVKAASRDYFSSDVSIRTGGAFTLTIPFTGPSSPSSISLTLSNPSGISQSLNAGRCQ